ncbi:MAG: ABC transporter substrate-binding protein [Arhodomonas sp.]|nr:ABC transporter substrate-binding protein [Arhodomonas sp.]
MQSRGPDPGRPDLRHRRFRQVRPASRRWTVVGEYDVEIVADETYGPNDTDMTAQLTKIANTDGLDSGPATAASVRGRPSSPSNYRPARPRGALLPVPRRRLEEATSSSPAMLLNGVRLPAAALLVADHLPGDDPQKPVVVAQLARSIASPPSTQSVSTFGGHAYDGLMIAVDAIERAGTAEPAAVRDAIEQTSGLMGTGGEFNMGPDDHLGLDLSAFRMLEIRNGDGRLSTDCVLAAGVTVCAPSTSAGTAVVRLTPNSSFRQHAGTRIMAKQFASSKAILTPKEITFSETGRGRLRLYGRGRSRTPASSSVTTASW